MGYSVKTEEWSGQKALVLQGNGAQALLLPEFGANLIRLDLPGTNGETVSVIDTPPDFATLQGRPTRYGAPVLFPFPGRVANSRFEYGNRSFELDEPADGGPARHGFVLQAPFAVVDTGTDEASAWVTLRFNGDTPKIARQYPSSFQFTMTFRLSASGLSLLVHALNTGDSSMPVGFGWHPYFHMPLTARGERGKCRLHTTCSETWGLGPDLVPTGRKVPIERDLDLRQAPPVGDRQFDNVLTTPQREADGWTYAALVDEASGYKLTVGAGSSFNEWVVFTPPGRNAACLEPYTCPGNALNLHSTGVDAGVIDLAPGAAWEDKIEVRLEKV